ncbi:NIPSNAP family protein [Chitinophaga sp. Cy-1792]|uniref:NIPSNAP family protein n=1 Tax=Chitinophaga sp. Cy-1792 TaxID=2608339 RepID=UPI00142395F9|nr:NIPSNAP family protein [Chitinophaga sp. Cy-1792]NIG56942.1 NIPSNAP family containing protein [Chitinophaga sp. Cy-1792]
MKSRLLSLLLVFGFAGAFAKDKGRLYYQIRVYHIKPAQEAGLDNFLQQAYLPALHRAGIRDVGVFKPISQDSSDNKVYVFTACKSLDQFASVNNQLQQDNNYQAAAGPFLDGYNETAPYVRIETILLQAFGEMPAYALPALSSPKNERVYELRSYESATERSHASKVKMFNAGGEVGIFKRLNFNAVFYGSVIAGAHMPNLMYLTTFNNKADRDAHWKSFGADPEWKKLVALPEYQHNVSHQDIIFVRPTEYSDI